MIYVTSQISFITGSNPTFISTGFSVVKNVGILFLNKVIIPTVAQESPNKKYLFFEKITKNKFKSNINKKIIYSLSIFGFLIILRLTLFFISQSKI